ncbi:hypothetical protein MHOCP_01940 [Moorella humiferrea]|uniref:Uncharacterized protein n=1 Tax=Neomoorella humiferrea TaxID=676965 RepID=A0A2T0ASE1_9FIRM|nr:hypothetical protein [Moorella humiferrea]PRR73151.1 hypothetical protein MOHU_12780 [Moorella humiferrea]
MADYIIDPNFLTVVQSLKPYMSERARQCTEVAETLLDVLTSEQVRQVKTKLESLRQDYKLTLQMVKEGKKGDKKGDMQDRDPFTLFLILLLLLLATDAFPGSII